MIVNNTGEGVGQVQIWRSLALGQLTYMSENKAPAAQLNCAGAVRLRPPPTDEKSPLAVFSWPPLTEAKSPVAVLKYPPLTEELVPAARLVLPPHTAEKSPSAKFLRPPPTQE